MAERADVDKLYSYADSQNSLFYSDSLMLRSSSYYNNSLALLSAELSLATYTAGGGKSSTDIDRMLLDMGCDYVSSEMYGRAKAFTVATKPFSGADAEKLLIIVAQGTTTDEEKIKDATAWADVSFRGYKAYDYMHDFSESIMSKVRTVAKNNTKYKVLVTGHSLGGAAANLVAAEISDEICTDKDSVYCYTFGAINAIATDKTITSGYENIHNIYNTKDTFSNDEYGFIMVTGAGGKNGKFGHLDTYMHDHKGSGKINHDMDLYRDDVRDGFVKKCKNDHNITISTINKISESKQYTGKAIKQSPRIVYDGTVLSEGKHYIVKYSNNKDVGISKMTIKGMGPFSGTTDRFFEIRPKNTSINNITADGSSMIVKWKKQSEKMSRSRISGYQIQIATDEGFSTNEQIFSIKGYDKTSKIIDNLLSETEYYIRIRTYKTINGVKYYSTWSKTKSICTDNPAVHYREMMTGFTFKYPDDISEGIEDTVKYHYNDHGLVDKVTGKSIAYDGKKYSYTGSKLKYTYYSNGYIKTVAAYLSTFKKPWVTMKLNENGVVTYMSWGIDDPTISECTPTYYPGTKNIKTLAITSRDDYEEDVFYMHDKFHFNENGYCIGYDANNGTQNEFYYDGNLRTGEYSHYVDYENEINWSRTEFVYKFSKDAKILSLQKNYYDSHDSNKFRLGTIIAKKWNKIKVNENTLRSARCVAAMMSLFWEEGALCTEIPDSFVYEW